MIRACNSPLPAFGFGITDEKLRPSNNNFTLVRFILASAVILTHSYGNKTGLPDTDWLSPWLGAPVSKFAVDGFFFLSGFLVFRSLHEHNDINKFLIARLSRMYPALLVSVLITVLAGLAFTSADWESYFGGETMRFMLGNLTFIKAQYSLTGVDCSGISGDTFCSVNDSLWTLPWEMRCYLVLVLLSVLGLVNRRGMAMVILPITIVLAISWQLPTVQELIQNHAPKAEYWLGCIARLWTLFAVGCAAALWRGRIRLHGGGVLILFLLNLLAAGTPYSFFARLPLVAYSVLYLGLRTVRWTAAIARLPDYSYGIYIYGYPVMLLVAAMISSIGPATLAVFNLLAVLPIAALSWHFIEKPVLDSFRRRSARARYTAERLLESKSADANDVASGSLLQDQRTR